MTRSGMTFLLICSAFHLTLAQDINALQGRVSAEDTGVPLVGAAVLLAGGAYYCICDQDGRFHFAGIPAGRYNLEIRHLGYETGHVRNIEVSLQTPWNLDIRLKPKPMELPELSVSTSRWPTGGAQSGARIVTQEQLRRIKPWDVADALQREGLIDVVSDGTPGGPRTLSLRGSAGDQVLVLLDGRPLNDPSSGTADLSRISLAEVEKIEIYPSPNSVLGAQAIGGVVNVVTLRPGIAGTDLQAAAGSFGEKHINARVGRDIGGWPFLAILEHRESDGEYRYRVVRDDGLNLYTRYLGQELMREDARYRREFISLKLDPPGIVELGYRQTALDRDNPDYLPLSTLDHESNTEDSRRELTVDLEARRNWHQPAVHLKAEGYRQRALTDYGESYPLLFRESDLLGEAYNGEATWNRHFEWQDVSYGAGARYERLWSADLEGGYAERIHKFAYWQAQGHPLENVLRPVRLGIVGGVRADFYSGQNAFLHPRIGIEISNGVAPVWLLRGELSSAYHLPSFNALFWQEDLQSRGNPNLKPERSINRELAAEVRSKSWAMNVAYFDRRVSDLIYWRLDFDKKWKPLNLSSARISGLESSLKGAIGQGLGRTEIAILHRWMRTLNESGEANTDGMQLSYRPEHTLNASLVQKLQLFSWDVAARWMGRRFTNEANTKSLSPYMVWDAGLSKSFLFEKSQTSLDLRLEVRNLFDVGYRMVEAAPMPLREWWLTIGFEWTAREND